VKKKLNQLKENTNRQMNEIKKTVPWYERGNQ
jgi:hypothetical protein